MNRLTIQLDEIRAAYAAEPHSTMEKRLERIGRVEQRVSVTEAAHTKLDNKVERWINRGIGVWGLAVTLFALLQFGAKFVK